MGLLLAICGYAFLFSVLGCVLPSLLIQFFAKPKDLRKAYGAKWSLVTGASSGIGKSLAKKLADQGLNVVLVAFPDKLLDATHQELVSAYPDVSFLKVPADLGRPGYLEEIRKQTQSVDIQVVFCNAGYMLTGLFEDRVLPAHLANLECNAVSSVALSHYFLQKMTAKSLKGCIVFTSSAAASIVSPMSALYAASKAFISSFGAALAVEVRHQGIDVLVFHPSPVASRFYDKAHKLDILEFFKGRAVDPDSLPDAVFAAIGRTVWHDIGLTAYAFRLMMKVIDYNLMAIITARLAPMMPDFRRFQKERMLSAKAR